MFSETLGISQDMGTTATPRRGAPGTRVELARGGASGAGSGERGVPVARGLAGRGRQGLGAQAGAGGSAPIARCATRAHGAAVAAGRQGQRLSPRAVDVDTPRGHDSGPRGGALSPRACLEALAPFGLERSGARASGPSVRRSGQRSLEALDLASDKTKSSAWAPLWSSWMRAAFYSSPPGAAPGLPPARRPSSPTATNMTASPPWRP